MSSDVPIELIKSTVDSVLDLLSDTESSDSEESDFDFPQKSNSDLTTALLIYANTLTSNNDEWSDDSEFNEVEEEIVSNGVDQDEDHEIDIVDREAIRKLDEVLNFPGIPEFTSMSSITDIDFKSHFGVNKSTVELLLGLLPEKNSLGRPQLNDLTFVLVSLWFLVTCEPHNSIAERFNLGKSHSHRVVVDFCSRLTELSSEYVTWPDRNDSMATIDTFKNNYGFPGTFETPKEGQNTEYT